MSNFLSDMHASMFRDGQPQELTPEEEASKRQMYESLKPRGRKWVDRIGYDKWDPFQKPNDPLDIRQDVTKRTTQQLVREFLQAMAKKLADAKAMMLVGAGAKGIGPLVMQTGGTPYRAFLEGRIQGDSYALILRLTNLELKSL